MIKNNRLILCAFLLFGFFTSHQSFSATKGQLSENIRIVSKSLNYSLQYRVYTPAGLTHTDKLPTIYLTDGQWYLELGNMVEILDREIDRGRIKPVIAIFVDSRDPDNLNRNRRNAEFFCNPDYVNFYSQELLPTIETNYPVSTKRKDRVIQGLSFGGYNAACFGLMANQQFAGIAMQSPANSKMLNQMTEAYQANEKLPLKIFLSFGKKKDNHIAGRKFKDALLNKGYKMKYKEVNFGHNWSNWRPLIDDSLGYFFSYESLTAQD